jgi:hypothetical protein
VDTTLQHYKPLRHRKRLHGHIDVHHHSETGGWIISGRGAMEARWYVRWADNPNVNRDTLGVVEFELTTDKRGRPVAVNVIRVGQR